MDDKHILMNFYLFIIISKEFVQYVFENREETKTVNKILQKLALTYAPFKTTLSDNVKLQINC